MRRWLIAWLVAFVIHLGSLPLLGALVMLDPGEPTGATGHLKVWFSKAVLALSYSHLYPVPWLRKQVGVRSPLVEQSLNSLLVGAVVATAIVLLRRNRAPQYSISR